MDGTLITLNRYMREPVPDIVLVGSSIAFRLKEEYFATPGLRNLALEGGSPVTGLEIVANQPRLPGLVLVEANVLARPTDVALVADAKLALQDLAAALSDGGKAKAKRAPYCAEHHWRHQTAPGDALQSGQIQTSLRLEAGYGSFPTFGAGEDFLVALPVDLFGKNRASRGTAKAALGTARAQFQHHHLRALFTQETSGRVRLGRSAKLPCFILIGE